ncbi:MAG: hypothetical protein MI861_01895 [Pirellulales bacterium]|nr:hypothetical protein [Pirellulales bacterium]
MQIHRFDSVVQSTIFVAIASPPAPDQGRREAPLHGSTIAELDLAGSDPPLAECSPSDPGWSMWHQKIRARAAGPETIDWPKRLVLGRFSKSLRI